MATAPVRIDPPAAEAPLADDGQHTKAWADYHQSVSDRLGAAQMRQGVADGSDAAAGDIGEYLTASGGPLALSTGVSADIATLSLTAGDWDVWGCVLFAPAATTHPNVVAASVSTASGALSLPRTMLAATFNTGGENQIGTGGAQRFSVAAATTAYLVGYSTFTTAGMTASGEIFARRMR